MGLRREARRALVAQSAVRSELIVFLPVILDHHAGLGKCPKLLPVQALVAEAPMEALHEP